MRDVDCVVAVDLGATSGRVILATFDGKLELREIHRFSTAAQSTEMGLRLDAMTLFGRIQAGIAHAIAAAPGPVRAVGVDSWAVDYGLLAGDELLDQPYNYRDPRCEDGRRAVLEKISPAELYARTGIQDQPFNTVNQLVHDLASGRLGEASRFLLLPDLIGYWLTGQQVAERTNASTTALLSPVTGDWDWELIDWLGLPRRIFPEVIEPGTVVGPIRSGAAVGIPLVAVGSHDTASAVAGAPLRGPDDVYLSSGTWSLLGMELPAPILTETSRQANFTNEAGLDGSVRYLKNITGLWLLSESIRTWGRQGHDHAIPELIAAARGVQDAPVFDAMDPGLVAPGDMPARLKALTGDPRLDDPAVLTRSVLESLAVAYDRTVRELASLTDRNPAQIVIVGGGSANTLLCRFAADHTGLPILAGPKEATAIGNALVQARAVGLITGSLSDARQTVMESCEITEYQPAPTPPAGLLEAICDLSNEFGADPRFTRAGGGNSSATSDGVLWIKPSGVSMATLTPKDLVPLRIDVLTAALDEPDPAPELGDPVQHLAQVARLDEGSRRPSVEILFHALIDDPYVLHTHPLLINAVTCNEDGETLTRELFGDEVLWVPYADPGLPLAREIASRRREYVERTGRSAPKVIFLMNHGLIVAGASPEAIRATSYRVVGRIQQALDEAATGLSAMAEVFRNAVEAAVVVFEDSRVAVEFPLTREGARFLEQGPLIPDQIVYAGAFPVVIDQESDIAEEVARYRDRHGADPKVAVFPGCGVAAVGGNQEQACTALAVYIDALTVAQAASKLGRVRALDERERRFIETWEAEAYRQKMLHS